MDADKVALQQLIDKDAIRDLVLLYSRAIDHKDVLLLRDLYTEDACDTHGSFYDGPASGFAAYFNIHKDGIIYCGHHVCNHLINVDGGQGEGEVYAYAYHIMAGADGERVEHLQLVRYLDNYRRCADGKWRFSKRFVAFDVSRSAPFAGDGKGMAADDPSYLLLRHQLFARGLRG